MQVPQSAIRLLCGLSLLVLLLPLASASRGDRDRWYQTCVKDCVVRTKCKDTMERPWYDELRWGCLDECKYSCQHDITNFRIKQGLEVLQYHGKWPFVRLFGMQEFLSTVFSVLNGIPHLMVLVHKPTRDKVAPAGYPLRPILLTLGGIGVNTWVWSAAFHTRDSLITERLDYHCATILLVSYCWIALVRLVVEVKGLNAQSIFWAKLISAAMFLSFTRHVYWLNTVKFDYGYNMMYNAVFFVTQVIVWMVWAYLARSRPYSSSIVKFQIMLASAAVFEALDFPPIGGLLDAHALWHGLTIGLGFYWYKFLGNDGVWMQSRWSKQVNV